jgi:KUP system potassium uptake protein
MWTWRRGRRVVSVRQAEEGMAIESFMKRLEEKQPHRVSGTAVFLTGSTERIPHALLHNYKHNKVLHERVILLTVVNEEVPWITDDKRLEAVELGHGLWRAIVHFGFMEEPNVPLALHLMARYDVVLDIMDTSFFLGRETVVPSVRPEMKPWQEQLFILMKSNAASASDFFSIPPNRAVELGSQIEV